MLINNNKTGELMFDYNITIVDTAYAIFLNFYKSNKDTQLLTPEDAKDLISVIGADFNVDPLKVEKDISSTITNMTSRIPVPYLITTNPTLH